MFARKLIAEAAGTTILCLFGISAAVSVAAAGTEASGLLVVALAHGLALMAGICAFGVISGAHFNPTVTVAPAACRGARCRATSWRSSSAESWPLP